MLINRPFSCRKLFDLYHWLYPSVDDAKIGAVGDFANHCGAPVPKCGAVEMMHQGVISLPKSGLIDTCKVKVLNPAQFPDHSPPIVLSPEGPSVSKSDDGNKVFSFTGKVDPDGALVDGVRIDWSSPPEAARVLVSPYERGAMHEATGWIHTKANGHLPAGAVPQSQNVIFSQPESVKRIEVQMRDSAEGTKSQFGIVQMGLVTHVPSREMF